MAMHPLMNQRVPSMSTEDITFAMMDKKSTKRFIGDRRGMMSGLNIGIVQLNDARKRLQQRWEATKPVWNDPVRWSFERKHWEPLAKQTQVTQRELEQLAAIIAKARQMVK